jgi:N-succinyldiaminopimelate aminotransferase
MSRPHAAERVSRFGTTVFSEFSALAQKHGAVNLGQGFPDFDGPEAVKEAAQRAIRDGVNQYAMGMGAKELRQAIAEHSARFYGQQVDPDTMITVTSGATEAILDVILGLVDPGDEVVAFEPFYDSYDANITFIGAKARYVPLRPPDAQHPQWWLDWAELEAAFSARTRLLILNSPQNPTGKVFTREELERIGALCVKYDVKVLSDEVYEHIVFEGEHRSPLEFAEGDDVVVVSACSKTYSMTGWRLGWVAGSTRRIERMLRVHQYAQACASAPAQYAAEAALSGPQDDVERMVEAFEERRDLVLDGLEGMGLETPTPRGAFYAMPKVPEGWVEEVIDRGVVVVPGEAFGERGAGYARISYATGTEELEEALEVMREATRAVR